jgi:adhesin transport system outer membrane protein
MKVLKIINLIYIASLMIGFSQFSFSEDSILKKHIQLSEAVVRSNEWHPHIKEARSKLIQQGYAIDVAESGYYPQINGGFRGGYEGSGDEGGVSQSLLLSASQMLYDFGKVSSAVEAEQAVLSQQQAELLLVIDEIAQRTASAVIEVWRFQELEKKAKEQVSSLEGLMDLVEVRHKKGASTKSDWVQSQTRVERAKALMLQYKTQKQIWQSRLSSMLGERQGIAVSLEPGIFKSVTCEYAQKSLSLVPILASALARKEQASAISKQSDARLMPTLTLNPTVTHYIQSPDWQTTTDREETEYGIYLNLNMPLYQGGALQAQKRAAAAAQISADAAVDGARLSILEVLLESSSQRETLKFHRQALKDREEYSRQTRDLYQQQYLELGSRPLLDLLNAEQDIYQAQLDQVNIESDMSSLGLSCANAKGELRQLFNLPVNE